MKAFWRLGTAATAVLLALAPASALAQVAVQPSAPAENAVGPAQLRDFSLDGTVIRSADPAPARSQPAPARQQPGASSAADATETAPERAEPARQAAQRETEPRRQPSTQSTRAPERSSTAAAAAGAPLNLPPPTPAGALFTPAPMLPTGSDTTSEDSAAFAPAPALTEGSGFAPLPWLFALLLLGGGAAYYFRRQRSPLAFAAPAGVSEFAAPDPASRPTPPRAAPAPAPAPTPVPPPAAGPIGIVSTRLRPWLDVQFSPDKVMIDGERAIVEFDIVVLNSGSGPARDVLVEAAMFNAGPDQDKEVGAFFARPVGQGDRIAAIGPLKSLSFRSAVNLPREQLRQFKAGYRTVFVPLIGINVLYRFSGGDAQTSAGYLVGKATKGEKLAPFGLESMPRTLTGLGARELEIRVRK